MPDTQPTAAAPLDDAPAPGQQRFPCAQCGARLHFLPGTEDLVCPYCQHRNTITHAEGASVEERDFAAALDRLEDAHAKQSHDSVKCDACGARPGFPENATSVSCPFCGSNIVSQQRTTTLLKPDALLPFAITESQARTDFRKWIASLWFAPSELKNFVRQESRLNGMYVPYWTYDTDVITDYQGLRGEAYYVTVPYTVTVNGRTQTRTRRERRIRWSPRSGTVRNTFDDVLVLATASLPRKHAVALEPWDLKACVPYADEYLSGFASEAYSLGLRDGFGAARQIIAPAIEASICADIGGDEQRISSARDRFNAITFKHVLLPVWISAYRYRGRAFRILINARTGEVQGERPYSPWKIAGAVMAGLLIIGAIVAVIALAQR